MRRLLLVALAGGIGGAALAQEPLPTQPPQMPPVLPGALPEAAPGAAPESAPAAPPVSRLPERVSGVPGTWDLSRAGSNFRCVMTLALDSGAAGRRLGFPAGCRRALPVTARMAGWLWTEQDLRLVDRDLRPLLTFTRRPDGGSFGAQTESGEVYSFVPLDIAAMRPPEPEAALPPPPPLPGTAATGVTRPDAPEAPPAVPEPATAAAGPRAEPGLYALDRYRDHDTCRLDLAAGHGVRILPGCRDGGIAIFDPARWSVAAGRLTLTARRGHTVNLVPTGDGGWRRDPETGTTFVLRKVEP